MLDDILVTIIIPVYNSEKYLRECLSSCLRQYYWNLDILIVNDGSIDRSIDIINEFTLVDARVRVISKDNAGLVDARKTGALNALSDYLVFLDSDDVLCDNAISLLVENLHKSDADVVLSNFVVELENGKKLFDSNANYVYGLHNSAMILNVLSKNVPPTIWGKLIKKSIFLLTNTPSEITIGEDVITMLQMFSLPIKISYINECIYHYIQRPGSMVNLKNKSIVKKRLLYLNWVISYIENLSGLEDKTKLKCLDIFIINEYFCLLKDGGIPSSFYSIYLRVNRLFREDKKLFDLLGKGRTLLIWLYMKNIFLASFYRDLYLFLRKLIYSIK